MTAADNLQFLLKHVIPILPGCHTCMYAIRNKNWCNGRIVDASAAVRTLRDK